MRGRSTVRALCVALCVPSVASLDFDVHGQDVTVRDDDGSVVFFSGVPDTSHGSDTDEDLTGDEEFFRGCMWTFRQKVEVCEGSQCGEAEFMAHHLQRDLLRFYADARHPPPLADAAWLVLGTKPNDRREMFLSCPGLVAATMLLMVEALAFADAPLARSLANEAASYIASIQGDVLSTALTMFPVASAYQSATQALEAQHEVAGTLDIVIARCKSPLQWLWELELPPRTRVLVYEKCGATDTTAETAGLSGHVEVLRREVREDGSLMTGECTAYADHVQRVLASGSVAEHTVFVHDDAPRHIRTALLALALRSIGGGASVPFLHLSHERYPAFRTPCLEDVYTTLFGGNLPGLVSTYCCSHFVVSRERLMARPVEFFERLQAVVREAQYSTARGGRCAVRDKPCYLIEFFWHHIFGEPLDMPLRAENPALPVGLRFEGGRFSRTPSPLQVSPYMAFFKPKRYSDMLRQR